MTIDRRPIGHTDIEVSPVALGGWPITGITSLDVNEADNLATVRACLDHGINFVDTAYCYGANGESEMLIRRALGERRNEMVIATKAGVHWEPDGSQTHDGRPETLKRECEESLRRLGTDCVDLLYQHRPDPDVPVAESAGALRSLMESGKTRSVGVSVMVYWPLMLGLLAGKLQRDHVFPARDGRAKYPMFQNEEYRKNLDFVDRLREVADEAGKTVAQVVINWTIHQVGITVAICGAKRADQVADNAGGMDWQLSSIQLAQINRVLEERGEPVTISPSPAMSARADGTPGRVE